MKFWLMKSEPDVYSIEHLRAEGTDHWDGVRNYQARNFMRDEMKLGDQVLFYHSNCKVPGVAGLAEVAKEAYADFTSWDPKSPYHDPKSTEDSPRWMMVDVKWIETFPRVFSLEEIKKHSRLKDMLVAKKGQRLSIQPVDQSHFKLIHRLVHKDPS